MVCIQYLLFVPKTTAEIFRISDLSYRYYIFRIEKLTVLKMAWESAGTADFEQTNLAEIRLLLEVRIIRERNSLAMVYLTIARQSSHVSSK